MLDPDRLIKFECCSLPNAGSEAAAPVWHIVGAKIIDTNIFGDDRADDAQRDLVGGSVVEEVLDFKVEGSVTAVM